MYVQPVLRSSHGIHTWFQIISTSHDHVLSSLNSIRPAIYTLVSFPDFHFTLQSHSQTSSTVNRIPRPGFRHATHNCIGSRITFLVLYIICTWKNRTLTYECNACPQSNILSCNVSTVTILALGVAQCLCTSELSEGGHCCLHCDL